MIEGMGSLQTATLSLWYFYILLARDNPNINFHLHHTIVEREKDFVRVLNYMTSELLQIVNLSNLQVDYDILQNDIYDRMIWENKAKYDLVFESNVFNSNEGLNCQKLLRIVDDMYNSLVVNGNMVILILIAGGERRYDYQCK